MGSESQNIENSTLKWFFGFTQGVVVFSGGYFRRFFSNIFVIKRIVLMYFRRLDPIEPFIDLKKGPKPKNGYPRGGRFLRGFFKAVFPEFQNLEKICNFVKKFSLHFELSRIFL